MKFFIPEIKTPDDFLENAIRPFVEQEGFKTTDRRIFKLHYIHEGIEYHVEVGKPDPRNGEIVMAILETKESTGIYYICTPNRGVARGIPILVGFHEAQLIEDFE